MSGLETGKLVVEMGSLIKELGESFKIFKKFVRVFALFFVATEAAPDNKVLHGASVLYQYIDNNNDGIPDNKEVYKELVKLRATMVMFRDDEELEKNESFLKKIRKFKNVLIQDLQADETRPGSRFPHRFDASLEECFQLVTTGYAEAYKETFGLYEGIAIANAMDKARGGYFKKVPKRYPAGAWFTYYDKTCDYKYMIAEYVYWAFTSMLGMQKHRGEEIEHEWKLYTRKKLEAGDPKVFNLLSDPQFVFPTRPPVPLANIARYDAASDSSGISDSSDNREFHIS